MFLQKLSSDVTNDISYSDTMTYAYWESNTATDSMVFPYSVCMIDTAYQCVHEAN